MNHFTFSACVASISTLIATIIFLARPSKLDKLTGIYWFSISFWAFTVGWQAWILKLIPDYIWGWFLHLGCVTIPALFFHFACAYSGHDKEKPHLIKGAYLITATYLLLNTFTKLFTYGTTYRDFYAYPTTQPVYPLYFITFILMIVVGTIFMVFPKRVMSPTAKKWLYVFIVVHSIAYTGGLDNFFIMADLRIPPLYPYGLYPILPYALIGSFALIKSNQT